MVVNGLKQSKLAAKKSIYDSKPSIGSLIDFYQTKSTVKQVIIELNFNTLPYL